MMRATPESPRMFESDFFDYFSRIPFWVVAVIFGPLTIALLAVGVWVEAVPLVWAVPQFAAGFVVWTLFEYWLHRTFFHWVPDTWWGPKMHFFVHGVHHEWVFDKLRLVMPPAVSISLAVLFFVVYQGLALALSPWVDPSWFWCFFAGKVAGYMNYDLTHYYIHHGKPTLKFYKRLRHHHNSHHHNPKYEDLRFGVSFRVWDTVFGTMEPRT